MNMVDRSFYVYIFMPFFYLRSISAKGFDYNDTKKWSENFPICGEKYQSPIDLTFQEVKKVGTDVPLQWCGYDNIPKKMILENNGHSITMTGVWPPNETPHIRGGPLPNEYVFEQLHFHWGPNNSVGSEHTVNGNSFPLEMHMVHYNRNYKTFTNATNFRDGLSVVGFFFDLSSTGTPGLDDILGGVAGVRTLGSKTELTPFALTELGIIPASVQLCTYPGSLTTPPCSQIVIWILPINLLKATAKQLELFRSIELYNKDILNYRTTQPINGRTIHVMTQWSKFYGTDVYKVVEEPEFLKYINHLPAAWQPRSGF